MPLLPSEGLTPRENEVLELLKQGHPNKQIARVIGVSDQTVKYHLKNIYVKLGAHSRAHAVALASQGELPMELASETAEPAGRCRIELAQSPLTLAARTRRLYADRPAVIDGEVRLSYAQFFERCDRWSTALQALGVAQGDRVATVADNIHGMIEQFYAVPAIGAVIVPINVLLSAEDFAYVLAHSQARVVCASRSHLAAIDGIRAKLPADTVFVSLEGPAPGWLDYEALIAETPPQPSPCEIADQDVISISYTSGTSFRPRGVVLSHRNVWLNALCFMVHWPLKADDRYLWTLPLTHCNGWGFVWTVTAAGACHICVRDRGLPVLVGLVRDESVTCMSVGRTQLQKMSECPPELRAQLPQGVRVLTAGSSPAPVLIERVERDLAWEVTHAYGLTETSPFLTVCDERSIRSQDPQQRARLKARQGLPVLGACELRVVDEEDVEVPRDGNTAGEIVVRGGNVMLGYYRDDAATARAFSRGWFHTGDAAVVHEDGSIEIRDRIKDIIISGDQLVAPVEVEDALMRDSQVLEAAVVGVPDRELGEVVHAFVVPSGRTLGNPEGLRSHLEQYLAPFKLPRHFHVVDALPKTPTGKVRKQVLREMAVGG